ncbi:hypothetical protein [Roseofilum casamattae]|uniref:Uncharacterized protein n=1 Tax=Roseofilum casamattae BLCC-M143 TaxID=3022442 RepID=A0ABT7BY52_9CYAN|nr:hypothetical protein [Roseofilum casamattae]MDJ1184124.1 hypothetical protein [Roseofilum casamattae BLCC-M143]
MSKTEQSKLNERLLSWRHPTPISLSVEILLANPNSLGKVMTGKKIKLNEEMLILKFVFPEKFNFYRLHAKIWGASDRRSPLLKGHLAAI